MMSVQLREEVVTNTVQKRPESGTLAGMRFPQKTTSHSTISNRGECEYSLDDLIEEFNSVKFVNRENYVSKHSHHAQDSALYIDKRSRKSWGASHSSKKKKKKQRKNKKKFSPQSGMDSNIPSCVSELLKKIDVIVSAIGGLCLADNWAQRTCTIHLAIRAMYPEATDISNVMSCFKALLCPVEPQSSDSWLDSLRSIFQDWKLLQHHPMKKNVGILVSACVLLGIVGPGKFTFSLGDLELFSQPIIKKQVSALSVFDAIVETTMYFFEVGHAVITEKSLRPLFFATSGIDELSKEIAFLKAYRSAASNGSIETMDGGCSVDEYRHRLNTVLSKMSEATFGLEANSYEKTILIRKMEEIERVRVEFESAHAASTQRLRPIAICVYSTSGCGKTTFVRETVASILMANGFNSGDQYMITTSDTDKYDSTMRSNVEAIIDDDVANQKAEYAPFSAAARIINYVNSKPYSANMAAVEDKGKVSCNIKVYAASTNMPTLEAYKTSNNPASVLCRFAYLVTITVRPEFCTESQYGVGAQLDSDKVFKFMEENGYTDPSDRDVWLVTARAPYVVPGQRGQPDSVGYREVFFEGKEMTNVSYKTWLRFITSDSRRYFENQRKIFRASLNVASTFLKCKHGVPSFCECKQCLVPPTPLSSIDSGYVGDIDGVPEDSVLTDEQEFGPQAGFVPIIGTSLGWFLRSWFNSSLKYAKDTILGEMRVLEMETTRSLYYLRSSWRNSLMNSWTDWIPNRVLETPIGRYMINRSIKCKNHNKVWWLRLGCFFALLCQFVVGCLYGFGWEDCAILMILAYGYKSLIVGWDRRLEAELLSRRDALSPMAQAIREKYAMRAIAFVGIAGLTYTSLVVFREFMRAGKQVMNGYVHAPFGTSYTNTTGQTHRFVDRSGKTFFQFGVKTSEESVFDTHGDLLPYDQDGIKARLSETNVWKVSRPSPTFVPEVVATSTLEQMVTKISSQLIHFSIMDGDNWKVSNAIAIKSRILLVPYHLVCSFNDHTEGYGRLRDHMKCRVIRYDRDLVGSEFENVVYARDIVHIANTDFALVYLPSLGDKKDITNLIVSNDFRGQCSLVYRNSQGKIDLFDSVVERRCKVEHKCAPPFQGGGAYVPAGTFNGLCMAPYISKGRNPFIVGYHLGGRSGKSEGIYGSLHKDVLLPALSKLCAQVSDPCDVQCGDLPTQIMGERVIMSNDIHPKCPTNFVSDNCHVDIAGSCVGKATFRPQIKKSLISEIVEEEFGVPNIWGNPSRHPWRHERNFLLNAGNGATRMEPSALEWSANDWTSGVVAWCIRTGTRFRKLSTLEAISGRDGDRFIDAMNKSTSVGFPLSGPKRNFFERLDPKDYPAWSDPHTIGPELQEEYDRIRSCYMQGRRAYPVFKSCPKNEALKLSKDKKRLFQVAPAAFQVIVREYFLELAKVLSLSSLISECSVGINAMGDEWEQMISYLEELPAENTIAGDYKNWDQVISPDVTQRAWYCLIEVAASIGATSEDCRIMRCIVADMVNPMLAFDGTLVQLHAGNPSGQNLTAHINCVINSLLLRCVWYLTHEHPGSFRDNVHLQVYGDDNLATTKDPSYNMSVISKVLGEFGYTYTDAFKNATTVPFVHLAEAEYLKRHSVYHDALGCRVGALNRDSIFKSLHCYDADSKISKVEHAEAVINSALLEFFLLGPQEYEEAREKFQRIAARVSVVSPVLFKDYETRVQEWHTNHTLS